VREAIKRLEQAGLVDVHHGGGTTVTDWRRRAGLDLIPTLIVTADGTVDPAVVRSIMELRAAVGPEVAARCAERMVPAVKAALAELADRYTTIGDTTSIHDLGALDVALWDALVEGSDNIAFRLAYNALRDESAAAEGIVRQLLAEEVSAIGLRTLLIDRVMDGDVDGARDSAAELLALGTAAITRAMAGATTTSRPKARRGGAR